MAGRIKIERLREKSTKRSMLVILKVSRMGLIQLYIANIGAGAAGRG